MFVSFVLVVLLLTAYGSSAQLDGAPQHPRKSCQAYAKFLPSIWEDLAAFAKEGITDTLLQTTWEEHNPLRTFPALKVSILNNTVYIAGRAERVFQFVRELLVYVHVLRDVALTFALPDVEFIIASDDEPTPRLSTGAQPPIFRHCKGTTDGGNILVPTFNLYATVFGARPPSISNRAREAALRRPWNGRQPKVVAGFTPYRRENPKGQCSLQERLGADGTVVENPREELQRWAQNLSDPRLLINTLGKAPIETWARFKFAAHVDGITCSDKLEQEMAAGLLVFREESGYRAFYHRLLRPFVHYVPFWVQRPQELLEALAWAEKNDAAAERIARAGQRLVGRFLSRRGLQCYWSLLLSEYAQVQRGFTPGQVRSPHGEGEETDSARRDLWDLTPADQWQRDLRAAAAAAGDEGIRDLTAAALKLLPGLGQGAKEDAGGAVGGGPGQSAMEMEELFSLPRERWGAVRYDDEHGVAGARPPTKDDWGEEGEEEQD